MVEDDYKSNNTAGPQQVKDATSFDHLGSCDFFEDEEDMKKKVVSEKKKKKRERKKRNRQKGKGGGAPSTASWILTEDGERPSSGIYSISENEFDQILNSFATRLNSQKSNADDRRVPRCEATFMTFVENTLKSLKSSV